MADAPHSEQGSGLTSDESAGWNEAVDRVARAFNMLPEAVEVMFKQVLNAYRESEGPPKPKMGARELLEPQINWSYRRSRLSQPTGEDHQALLYQQTWRPRSGDVSIGPIEWTAPWDKSRSLTYEDLEKAYRQMGEEMVQPIHPDHPLVIRPAPLDQRQQLLRDIEEACHEAWLAAKGLRKVL